MGASSTDLAAEGAPRGSGDGDWQALARVAEGDGEAMRVLVERHQERLLRLCERLLGDAEEGRDAAQEVFLKLFRKAGTFRPRGQVYTLLYRIATNHCLNRMRRRRLVTFLRFETGGGGEEDPPPAFDPPDPGPGPEEALRGRRRWRAVREAISALPPSQRAVLVLARFERLPAKVVARVLGITVGAVESRLFRALRHLERARTSETQAPATQARPVQPRDAQEKAASGFPSKGEER